MTKARSQGSQNQIISTQGCRMDASNALNAVGEFGKYQKAISLLLCFPILIGCMHVYMQVFAVEESDHWCQSWKGESCKDLNLSDAQCENLKKEISIPIKSAHDGDPVFEQCDMYDFTGTDLLTAMLTKSNNFTNLDKIPCDEGWIFNKSEFRSTITEDFELICDRSYLSDVAQSAYFGGILAGSVFGGAISDRFGRRTGLLISTMLAFAAGMSNVFAPSIWMFIPFRLLMGTFAMSVAVCCHTLASEIVSPSKRAMVNNILLLGWAGGYFVLSGLAKLIQKWRFLQLSITIVYVPVLILEYLFVMESPLWFAAKDNIDEAEKVLNKMAMCNGRKCDDRILKPTDSTDETTNPEVVKELLKQLLHSRVGIMITINMSFNWFVQSVVFYGLSLSTSSLGIDPYISFVISGAIEIPGYALCMFLPDWIGRQGTVLSTMVLGGISCCLTPLLPLGVWRALVAMAGKFCVTISFAVVYIWVPEISPTPLRSTALGVFSMSSRIGGILVPFLLALGEVWPSLPVLICGSLSIVAGLLALLLPETKDRPLPSTMRDTESLYRRSTLIEKKTDVKVTAQSSEPPCEDNFSFSFDV